MFEITQPEAELALVTLILLVALSIALLYWGWEERRVMQGFIFSACTLIPGILFGPLWMALGAFAALILMAFTTGW
jgi:hypothetical protein